MRAKKWISLMMAGAMAMSLAGCGSQETPASAETTGTVQASSEQPQATTEAAETTTDEDITMRAARICTPSLPQNWKPA